MILEKIDGELYIRKKVLVFLYEEDVPANIDETRFSIVVAYPGKRK
jgi:hypothetical protein